MRLLNEQEEQGLSVLVGRRWRGGGWSELEGAGGRRRRWGFLGLVANKNPNEMSSGLVMRRRGAKMRAPSRAGLLAGAHSLLSRSQTNGGRPAPETPAAFAAARAAWRPNSSSSALSRAWGDWGFVAAAPARAECRSWDGARQAAAP
jgi:hypothetical protein